MKPGKGRLFWKSRCRDGAVGFALAIGVAGCIHPNVPHGAKDANAAAANHQTNPDREILESYQVGFPDELTIDVNGRTTRKMVGPDGRIEMGKYGKPRVEGRSPPQIAELLAVAMNVPADSVRVRVTEYSSRQLFLFGPAAGRQQSVPYMGQETVQAFLQRAGAATDKAPGDIYVVRAHIVEDGRPEVFHVDWKAITTHQDDKTNLRLLPGDQVYIK